MKKYILILALIFPPNLAKADFWGGDLPLLMEIVTNTLNTLMELRKQTRRLDDELRGINNKINRIKTIQKLVQPSSWNKWKNPKEALRRLQLIYHTLPKEYRSKKADAIEAEISKAMNSISLISREAKSLFRSGKELERRGADASPGVAQKLTASGVGSLVAVSSQTLVIQSHITSLLSQMLAQANEKESRSVVSKGKNFSGLSTNLNSEDRKFSDVVTSKGFVE